MGRHPFAVAALDACCDHVAERRFLVGSAIHGAAGHVDAAAVSVKALRPWSWRARVSNRKEFGCSLASGASRHGKP